MNDRRNGVDHLRFAEDPKSEPAVKALLDAHAAGLPLPPLYATLKRDLSGRNRKPDKYGENVGTAKLLLKGQRVRVMQVTGFGDYGVTTVLEDDKNDEARATLAEMTALSGKP